MPARLRSECLAIALGGCIFNVCRIMAMERQMETKDLRISIAGDVDPSRAFGLETDTRAGFSQLSVQVEFPRNFRRAKRRNFVRNSLEGVRSVIPSAIRHLCRSDSRKMGFE